MDRFYTVPLTALPMNRFELQRGTFIIGQRKWSFPKVAQLARDAQNQLNITVPEGTYHLGSILRCNPDPVDPFYEFVPSPGDQITFIKSHGLLSWPTPYYSIMNATRASWARHSYDTLVWKKASGATLQLIWPDEQGFYAGVWADGNLQADPKITIRP